jgi:hypothetical protein
MVLITDERRREDLPPKLHWKQKEYAVARVLE